MTDERSNKPLTVAVAAAPIIRNLYRLMSERKKREAEAQTIPGEAVGSVRKGK